MTKRIILSFHEVCKAYEQEQRPDRLALRDVSFELEAGSTVAVIGRSGSGKSTLLNLAAGIDLPSAGRVRLDGRDMSELPDKARTLLRRETVGFVFQFFHLLPHLSVQDNIALPEWIAGKSSGEFQARVDDLLEKVGLAERRHDPVQKLSGGEMQRVAICRALLRKPPLLLADEPTGSLDDVNGRLVMELLLRLAREEGSTLITVTHSAELASLAGSTWRLHSGVLEKS
jgi:ABC-type lipoprotein export system ATPase subunit